MAPSIKTSYNKSQKSNQCKTKSSKKQTRKAEPILEYAGSLSFGDYWLKVGLTKNQLALVSQFARGLGLKRRPAATAARVLIMAALANLPLIEKSWWVMQRYADAEGFSCLEHVLDDRARAMLEQQS